jgi:hypothetical protein
MVGAILLIALASTQSNAIFTWNLNWAWLTAVALASLTTWLWSVRSRRETKPSNSRTRALITASSLIFASLYGTAAVIFISPDSIENSVFAAITLIALT